jgi:hypothetical protein
MPGMKYERFEQLPVWQAAIALATAVYVMTEMPSFRRRYSLRDQIRKSGRLDLEQDRRRL